MVTQTSLKTHKNEKQKPTNQQTTYNGILKTMGNITPTMDYYPWKGQMGDTNLKSDMPY